MPPSIHRAATAGEPRQPHEGGRKLAGNSPECAVAVLDHCVLLLWRRKIVSQGVKWVQGALGDLRKDRPDEKIGFFTVVEQDCELSTPPEVRQGLADLLLTHRDHLAGAAIAFEGRGFRMTMVRSVITAINMATRSRFPNSVFSDVPVAAAWLAARAPGSLRPDQIVATINEMRQL